MKHKNKETGTVRQYIKIKIQKVAYAIGKCAYSKTGIRTW